MVKNGRSLCELAPKLVEEWDYTKNSIGPEHFSISSREKVFWKCKEKHTWRANIYSRYRAKSQCPYCTGKLAKAGENDLATLYPTILTEWDNSKNEYGPENYRPNSGKKVWWKCDKGHSWEARIYSRTRANTMCPFCYGRSAITGLNDLTTLYPELIAEWDYQKNKNGPEKYKANSRAKIWWKCRKGHHWAARVYSRTRQNVSCPFCAGLYPIIGKTDLGSCNNQILLNEWDYDKNKKGPEEYTRSSNKRVWWKCEKGHSWLAQINSRYKNNHGCPYCAKIRPIPGETDISITHKYLLAEWAYDKNPISPIYYSHGSSKKVWWRCEKGHEWMATICMRADQGSTCPYCSGRYAIPGETDIVTTASDLMDEWDYEKNRNAPESYKINSSKKVWWRCKRGHQWRARIYHRAITGSKCPYCSGRYAIPGVTDLATTDNDIIQEWDFEMNKKGPECYTRGSSQKVWWICNNNHRWRAVISSRTLTGANCPICYKTKGNG